MQVHNRLVHFMLKHTQDTQKESFFLQALLCIQ